MSTTMSPFGQKASNKEGEEYELPTSGLHPGILIGLIDLGTHRFEYQGKVSENRKIFLAWELTAEHDTEGNTFVVGADYTWSLHKKSNFRKMLEAWSGRTFSEDEEFDPLVLVGKPCVLNIARGQTSKGKEFVEVSGVANPMRGQTIPPNTREPFAWHLSQAQMNEDPPIPDWMPRIYGRFVKDDIKASSEWSLLTQQPGHGNLAKPQANGAAKPVTNPSAVAPVETDKPPF